MTGGERVLVWFDRTMRLLEEDVPRRTVTLHDGAGTRFHLRSGSEGQTVLLGLLAPMGGCVLFLIAAELLRAAFGQVHYGTLLTVLGTLAVLGVATAAILATVEEVVVSSTAIEIHRGIGRFRRLRTIRGDEIRGVAVKAFSFASWDPFVAVETNAGTLKLWGVSDETTHRIADTIRTLAATGAGSR